jgi:dTMP kinase
MNKLIVFEGIDGSGKGTQIELLKKYFKKNKIDCFVFKYPTAKAKEIRDFLNLKIEWEEDEAFLKYIQDIKNEQPKVLEALTKGQVILDRYFYSTIAYQSINAPIEKRMEQIKEFKLQKADLVFWLDIEPEDAIKRKTILKVPDRFEQDIKKLQTIRKNYEKLYKINYMAKKWVKIDSKKAKEEIFKEIKGYLNI